MGSTNPSTFHFNIYMYIYTNIREQRREYINYVCQVFKMHRAVHREMHNLYVLAIRVSSAIVKLSSVCNNDCLVSCKDNCNFKVLHSTANVVFIFRWIKLRGYLLRQQIGSGKRLFEVSKQRSTPHLTRKERISLNFKS